MSREPPLKPARRRVMRSHAPEEAVSTSIDRTAGMNAAEGKPVDGDNATASAEEKSNSNGMKGDAKESNGEDSAGGAPKSPVKPGKPPKKDLSLNISNQRASGGENSAEEKQEVANRSVGKPIPQGFLGVLNTYLFTPMSSGYRMNSQLRQGQIPIPYKIKETRSGPADIPVEWSLCAHIESMLADTTGLVKPAIKVHAVYKDSGMYVKSLKRAPAAPISTSHVALGDNSVAKPSWGENLMIGADFQDIVADDTVLLFEVLDDRPSLATTAGSQHRQHKRIAWGYLLPIGNKGQLNVGICKNWNVNYVSHGGRRGNDVENEEKGNEIVDKSIKLQLYSCIDDDGLVGIMQRNAMNWPTPNFKAVNDRVKDSTYPDGIPSVYMQWRMQTYNPIPKAHLNITLFPRQNEANVIANGVPVPSAYAAVVSNASPGKKKAIDPEADKEIKAFNKAKSFAIKRLRGPKEPCVVPEKLLRRIDVGPEGAMVVQFSTSGHLLAVASKITNTPLPLAGTTSTQTLLGDIYAIHLFDVDSGDKIWSQQTAHHGVIYSIEWSLDDRYFVSGSGDGTAKAWDASGLKERHDEDDDMPFLLYTMTTSPPVFVYSAIFQEYAPVYKSKNMTEEEGGVLNRIPALPRIIVGASDGRIRVWDQGEFKGYVSIENQENDKDASAPTAHSDARIHSLTIDQRSRYLLSGDSLGNVFVWRTDSKGWYQLLRRFRRDSSNVETNSNMLMQSSGIQSLSMHPDKSKSQVLVSSQCPSSLKLFSTSTYKPLTVCNGVGAGQLAARTKTSKASKVNTSGAVFGRATISPDGRYAISGVSALSSSNAEGHYNLKVWEAQEGNIYPSTLSEINLPFPVRSISWHPKQHVLAVAMVGLGAAVAIYSGERESAELAVGRMAVQGFHDTILAKEDASESGEQV